MAEIEIEAPEREVVRITGTIEFTGGGVAGFTVGHDEDTGSGEQPWVGKSTDVRRAIIDALLDEGFWDDGRVTCPNCGEVKDPGEMNFEGMPYEMCDSCVHNATRSGWVAPSERRIDDQLAAIKVLARYELESDANGYDGTPGDVVDEMAAVIRRLAEATE